MPDRTKLAGDGYDAQPVTVEVIDARGRVVPTADVPVTFTLSGPGAIIGLNNGDPTNHEPEKGNQHATYHGLAQVILQTSLNGTGKMTLRASSPGLASGEVSTDVIATPAPPAVPELGNPPLVILNWKRSPVTADRLDPNQQLMATDMNSWTNARPGAFLPPFRNGRFAVYRATFTPRAPMRTAGCQLIVRDVIGKAEVYLNGKMVAEKTGSEKGTMTIAVPAGEGERTLSILIEAPTAGTRAGLGGTVSVE